MTYNWGCNNKQKQLFDKGNIFAHDPLGYLDTVVLTKIKRNKLGSELVHDFTMLHELIWETQRILNNTF